MRVALFFDGKNFYSGWRAAERPRLSFPALAQWLVRRVGGNFLWGAHYYTSVETGGASETQSQEALRAYLEMLDLQPGYFVRRFPRKAMSYACQHCGQQNRFTQEKEVDTTLVADILRLAAVNAFDIVVLLSGDADHAPAIEGVRALGKQAYVATWGKVSLSKRIRQAAFDHVDLLDGLAAFGEPPRDELTEAPAPGLGGEDVAPSLAEQPLPLLPGNGEAPPATRPPAGGDVVTLFVREVGRAEEKFDEGYVGLNYFLTRWKSDALDPSPDLRRRILDQAVATGRVEIYDAKDGAKAVRCRPAA